MKESVNADARRNPSDQSVNKDATGNTNSDKSIGTSDQENNSDLAPCGSESPIIVSTSTENIKDNSCDTSEGHKLKRKQEGEKANSGVETNCSEKKIKIDSAQSAVEKS